MEILQTKELLARTDVSYPTLLKHIKDNSLKDWLLLKHNLVLTNIETKGRIKYYHVGEMRPDFWMDWLIEKCHTQDEQIEACADLIGFVNNAREAKSQYLQEWNGLHELFIRNRTVEETLLIINGIKELR